MAELGQSFMAPVLANQEYMQRQQSQPVEIAQKLASTRYTTAMADRLETETAGEKKLAAAMAQMAGGGPETGGAGSISSKLLAMSDAAVKAGLPTKATALAAQAAQAQAHEATASAAKVRQAFQQTQLEGKQFEMATKLLNGVKDSSSWEEANALFERQTGKPSPFKDIPYDPQVVKLLQDSAETAYQKQLIGLHQQDTAAHLRSVASAIASRATRDQIAGERLRVTEQRELRLSKTGGKDIGSPGKVETEAAARLLGDQLQGDDKDAAAFSIASDARVIRRKNPGVSADEAIRQAYVNAQQSGSIVPAGPKRMFGLAKGEPGKFITPQEIPKSGKASDLVVGQHYKAPDGRVMEWTGKKDAPWKAVSKGKAVTTSTPAPSGGGSDGEDPEGDDNE